MPSWARTAAYTVPFTVLPSSLWRIAAYTFHLPITRGGLGGPGTPSGIPGLPLELYTPLLSVASEILAFSAVGLIAAWGEQFPRWLPPLAGRRVPTPAAAVPAAAASLTLTLLWGWTAVSLALGRRIDGRLQTSTTPLSLTDWKGLLAVAAYAPLLMWGPLLASLTISYIQRRRDPNARGTPTPDHARRGQDRGEDRRGP